MPQRKAYETVQVVEHFYADKVLGPWLLLFRVLDCYAGLADAI